MIYILHNLMKLKKSSMATSVIDVAKLPPKKRCIRLMAIDEDKQYMRKIEELAYERLIFYRMMELYEEEEEEQAVSERPPTTSTGEDDRKKKKKGTKKRKATSSGGGRMIRRKAPKRTVRTPVVSNEATQRLNEFIVNEMKGTEVRLVIQKMLYDSDTSHNQNRLNMPINQLESDAFLREDERRIVYSEVKGNEIDVDVFGPTFEGVMPMKLTMWHMSKTVNYVLKTRWFEFWWRNKEHMPEKSRVQVWSFRSGEKLCFAVVCVEKPDEEDDKDDVA